MFAIFPTRAMAGMSINNLDGIKSVWPRLLVLCHCSAHIVKTIPAKFITAYSLGFQGDAPCIISFKQNMSGGRQRNLSESQLRGISHSGCLPLTPDIKTGMSASQGFRSALRPTADLLRVARVDPILKRAFSR